MTSAGSGSFWAEHFGLHDRVALVTGASGGIGVAIARGLAAAGAAVMLAGRDAARLEAAQKEIVGAGGRAAVTIAELAEAAAAQPVVEDTVEALGGLHILVNCAGMNRRQPILEVQPETFDHIIAVNLRSAYFLSQAAARHMIAAGGGKIVNIGSLTCTIGISDISAYGASKAGLASMTKSMAVEWAEHNIQVNCLAPGFIMTPLTEKGLWGDERRSRWMLDRIPARRPGMPDDMVGMAVLMASRASDYMTGQVVTLDGGLLAGSPW
jgi:NAD(P)-dependent dehydrogenase (short-subunit alcohol dehydrogenase family)